MKKLPYSKPNLRIEFDQWDFWSLNKEFFVKIFFLLDNLPMGALVKIRMRYKKRARPRFEWLKYAIKDYVIPWHDYYEDPAPTMFRVTPTRTHYQEELALGCTGHDSSYATGMLEFTILMKKEVIAYLRFRVDAKKEKLVREEVKGFGTILLLDELRSPEERREFLLPKQGEGLFDPYQGTLFEALGEPIE